MPSTRPAVQSLPSNTSIESAICAAVFPHGTQRGSHCKVTRLRVATADPAWVVAHEGIYDDRGQLASDEDQVIFNLSTHELIGPTNVGFCGIDPSAPTPSQAYTAIPADVLAGLGLTRCVPSADTTAPLTKAIAVGSPAGLAAFTGTWGAHESSLTIDRNGVGLIKYADISRCPNCSEADAPLGTLTFVLTVASNGIGLGRVTASSDLKNWAVGGPVKATISPGSPGRLLNLDIAGKSLLAFCDAAAAGQCGA